MNQFDKCEFVNQFKIKSSVLSNFFQLKFLEMMSAHKKITSELGLYCLSDSEVAILSWLVGPASRLHQQFLWNSLTWSNDASTPVVCDASSRGNMLAFPFFEPFRLWWVTFHGKLCYELVGPPGNENLHSDSPSRGAKYRFVHPQIELLLCEHKAQAMCLDLLWLRKHE